MGRGAVKLLFQVTIYYFYLMEVNIMTTQKTTVASMVFGKEYKVQFHRLDNGFTSKVEILDKAQMHNRLWYVLHSPKLSSIVITTDWYSAELAKAFAYCEANGIEYAIHFTKDPSVKTLADFKQWLIADMQNRESAELRQETLRLIVTECPELVNILKRQGVDELTAVLRAQIRNSGYDVSLSSTKIIDCPSCGILEDGGKPVEWSRNYQKQIEVANESLHDLVLQYISCKFYASVGIAPDRNNEISFNDIDSYTGDTIEDEIIEGVTITPATYTGEYIQMFLN